jgi:hypothetical protein
MSKQLSIFEPYPNSPGFKRRDTSKKAAVKIRRRAFTIQDQLKALFAAGNKYTADEAGAILGISPFSCRPRCTELAEQGLIRDSGHRRLNASGVSAIVWVGTGFE